MVGAAQYLDGEIQYVLEMVVEKRKVPEIKARFEARFGKTLNNNQVRYIKNKYGKDPRFNSPLVNSRSRMTSSRLRTSQALSESGRNSSFGDVTSAMTLAQMRGGVFDERAVPYPQSQPSRYPLPTTSNHPQTPNMAPPNMRLWGSRPAFGMTVPPAGPPEVFSPSFGVNVPYGQQQQPVAGWSESPPSYMSTNRLHSPLLNPPVSFPYFSSPPPPTPLSPLISRSPVGAAAEQAPNNTSASEAGRSAQLIHSSSAAQRYSPTPLRHQIRGYGHGHAHPPVQLRSIDESTQTPPARFAATYDVPRYEHGTHLQMPSQPPHGLSIASHQHHLQTSLPTQSQEYGQNFFYPVQRDTTDPILTTTQHQIYQPAAEQPSQRQQQQPTDSPQPVSEFFLTASSLGHFQQPPQPNYSYVSEAPIPDFHSQSLISPHQTPLFSDHTAPIMHHPLQSNSELPLCDGLLDDGTWAARPESIEFNALGYPEPCTPLPIETVPQLIPQSLDDIKFTGVTAYNAPAVKKVLELSENPDPNPVAGLTSAPGLESSLSPPEAATGDVSSFGPFTSSSPTDVYAKLPSPASNRASPAEPQPDPISIYPDPELSSFTPFTHLPLNDVIYADLATSPLVESNETTTAVESSKPDDLVS